MRAERTRKRLHNVLKKKASAAMKTEQKMSEAFTNMCAEVTTKYGFEITDEPGTPTVLMVRVGSTGKEEVRIEFEQYKKPEEYDDDAIIMLFDIIMKQEEEGKNGSMVFTCTTDPAPTLLSVRFVPEGRSHLDQGVFDGPASDKVPPAIRMGLFGFLRDKGVDLQVFDFVKAYAVRKYERERATGMAFAASFTDAAASP
jgi:hypothetical protein